MYLFSGLIIYGMCLFLVSLFQYISKFIIILLWFWTFCRFTATLRYFRFLWRKVWTKPSLEIWFWTTEIYRHIEKLPSPSSWFMMGAEISLKLPKISAGLQAAMSEVTFFKFPGNFPLSPTHSSDTYLVTSLLNKFRQLLCESKKENNLRLVFSFLFRVLRKDFYKGVTRFWNLICIHNLGPAFFMGENWAACSHQTGRSAVEGEMYDLPRKTWTIALKLEILVWKLLETTGIGVVIWCFKYSHWKSTD